MVESESAPAPFLSSKVYDVIRYLVQYVLPGGSALYYTLAALWGFGYAEQVVGTTAAVTLFLGLLLGISKSSYNASGAKYDGAMVVNTSDPLKDTYSLEIATPFEEMRSKNEIVLKVQNPDKAPSQ